MDANGSYFIGGLWQAIQLPSAAFQNIHSEAQCSQTNDNIQHTISRRKESTQD